MNAKRIYNGLISLKRSIGGTLFAALPSLEEKAPSPANFKAAYPSSVLYRGDAIEMIPGQFLDRPSSMNPYDERGNKLYASGYFWHAAAYKFRNPFSPNVTIGVLALGGDTAIPFVVIGLPKEARGKLEETLQAKTYVATVSKAPFEPQIARNEQGSFYAYEWTSKTATPAQKVDEVPKEKLLGNVMLITTDAKTFQREQERFSSPEDLGRMIDKNVLTWENPDPQEDGLLKEYGENIRAFLGLRNGKLGARRTAPEEPAP